MPREMPNFAASNVKALRTRAKISRRELVETLQQYGVSLPQTSLRRIEEGEQAVKIEEALAFSDIFGIPLNEFVTEPLEGVEVEVSVAIHMYQDCYSQIMPLVWRAIEARKKLVDMSKDSSLPSTARSQIQKVIAHDEKLIDAATALSIEFNALAVHEKEK